MNLLPIPEQQNCSPIVDNLRLVHPLNDQGLFLGPYASVKTTPVSETTGPSAVSITAGPFPSMMFYAFILKSISFVQRIKKSWFHEHWYTLLMGGTKGHFPFRLQKSNLLLFFSNKSFVPLSPGGGGTRKNFDGSVLLGL